MATIRRECVVAASPEAAWDAIRDVGAVHRRLARGFVSDVRMEPGGVRVVTFANGMVVREPIVTIDDKAMRLAWAAEGGRTTHYNASLTVTDAAGGASIVWVADFLPDVLSEPIAGLIDAGMAAMQRTLNETPPAGARREEAEGPTATG